MKTETHYIQNIPLADVVAWGNEEFEGNFDLRITQYTKTLRANGEKFFFGNTPMDKMTFIFYQKMLKDSGGELRVPDFNVKYYDFSGINKGEYIKKGYSVDINSAYLTALKNEHIIKPETFEYINNMTTKNAKAKMSRLKSVGLFAKNPVDLIYRNGEILDINHNKSDLAWIFFLACKKIEEAMFLSRLAAKEKYLFYWVDGIFIRENPEIIVEKLTEQGFQSKIENVENIRIYPKSIIYNKEGKEKILFLPQCNGEEIRNVKSEIGKYKTL